MILPTEYYLLLINPTGRQSYRTLMNLSEPQEPELPLPPMSRGDCQAMRELYHHPSWPTLLKTLGLSRQGLVKRLLKEEDLMEIYRLQGQLEQIRIWEITHLEIEALDNRILKAEELRAMKEANEQG
jgi:hypothetical protein